VTDQLATKVFSELRNRLGFENWETYRAACGDWNTAFRWKTASILRVVTHNYPYQYEGALYPRWVGTCAAVSE